MSFHNSTARNIVGISRKRHVLWILPCLLLVFSGCAIPLMELSHEATVGTTYMTKGSLKVANFEDQRPSPEKKVGKTAKNTLSPDIWSGETNPDMMSFFQQTLIEEAGRSGLFSIADTAEYELSGYVNSMKADRKVDILYYLVPILGRTSLSATVGFHASLSKDGEVVFETDIKNVGEDSFSGMTEFSWKGTSKKAGLLLDKTISKSIRQLFDEIETAIQ